MFERDASLALSDARFLTEGTDTLTFHHPQSVRHYLPHSGQAVRPTSSLVPISLINQTSCHLTQVHQYSL